ncbi:MAG: hypothetical protein ABJP66_20415 [Hyphomicrobiales bacterium]
MIRSTRDRILCSQVFTEAPRLGAFLNYVVNKQLEEPDVKIQAKAIAEDLYNRSPAAGPSGANLVRVDAGRLRRRLDDYYAGPGRNDQVIIHIDTGGYNPRFEFSGLDPKEGREFATLITRIGKLRGWPWIAAAVVFVVFLTGIATGFVISGHADRGSALQELVPSQAEASASNVRKALLSASLPTLEAVNLSEQARNLLFPLIELDQIRLTLSMFKLAIRKDASYFGGYAGAAQSLATLAIFSPDPLIQKRYLTEARSSAEKARQLSPTVAWTHSALAWVNHAEGNPDKAAEHTNIAVQLAPVDGHILDFHAVLMLCLGQFEAARMASAPSSTEPKIRNRVINYSFNGAANFHLGLYQEALAALLGAVYSGEPLSAPTLGYIAATYQALGNTEKAHDYARQLSINWPGFEPEKAFSLLYINPEQAVELQLRLVEAGWKAGGPSKS